MLFELFTGEKLFPGDEAEDIIKNIETMPIPKTACGAAGRCRRGSTRSSAGPLARKPIDRPVRPATVLRSLIELSLRVEHHGDRARCRRGGRDACCPPKRISGPGQQLDDVIRKQLGQAGEVGRAADRGHEQQAAVARRPPSAAKCRPGCSARSTTTASSRLEEMDNPTAVAAPRARRNTERKSDGGVDPDSGLHQLLEKVDGDRRTEPGAPPTGAAPKIDPNASSGMKPPRATTNTGGKSITTFTGKSRRGWWIAATIAALAGGGAFAVWKLKRQGSDVVVPVAQDAGIVEQFGVMEIIEAERRARHDHRRRRHRARVRTHAGAPESFGEHQASRPHRARRLPDD